MFPGVCGITDCIMQVLGGENMKQKPLENTRFEKEGLF
jgi:hypothetical protein